MKTKSLYEGRKEFYTDPVNGRFNKIRLSTMSFVALLFFLLPWINWNNHQAFLFDIIFNRFYIFGSVFWPQDFILIAFICIFCVISLFAITVYSGRIWCGFFCPQSIWIKLAAFFTRLLEGKRNNRIKFANTNTSLHKVFIIFFKHIAWFILSFVTAFTFIGYFIPIRLLFFYLITFDVFYNSFFWILFFSLLTYFNIGWFKEQFCFLVCPYARLQSVMFDENTLIVSYNSVRGEKRGSRSKYSIKEDKLGDCIDCRKCVNCCPTGIDIRDGLQMECISCGACVDACNDVMIKIGYKPNLISFNRDGPIRKKINRLRLILYSLILVSLILIISYFLINRPLLHFNVSRSQYQLFNINKENLIENYFTIKFINKDDREHRYLVYIDQEDFELCGVNELILKPGNLCVLNVIVKTPICTSKDNIKDINFNVVNVDTKEHIKKKNKFIFPYGDF